MFPPKYVKNPLADHSSIDKYRILKSDLTQNDEIDHYWVIPEISITTATLTESSKPFAVRPMLNEMNEATGGLECHIKDDVKNDITADVIASIRAPRVSSVGATNSVQDERGDKTVQVEHF